MILVQLDWGGEFRPLQFLLKSCGITHRVTCPYSHAQNGNVECHHRNIVETGLSLLVHAFILHKYWVKALQTTVYLINRMPTSILQNSSPYQMLFNQTPDYKFLRTFGIACWPNLRPTNLYKVDFRSKLCVFMAYSLDHKEYICLHIPTSQKYLSRDVHFIESEFSFVM